MFSVIRVPLSLYQNQSDIITLMKKITNAMRGHTIQPVYLFAWILSERLKSLFGSFLFFFILVFFSFMYKSQNDSYACFPFLNFISILYSTITSTFKFWTIYLVQKCALSAWIEYKMMYGVPLITFCTCVLYSTNVLNTYTL